MLPAPNFFAGILIGVANEQWLAVLVAAFGWGIVFCFYVSLFEVRRKTFEIEQIRQKGQRLLFNSPTMTFYQIEFLTGFMTSLVMGSVSYGFKVFFS